MKVYFKNSSPQERLTVQTLRNLVERKCRIQKGCSERKKRNKSFLNILVQTALCEITINHRTHLWTHRPDQITVQTRILRVLEDEPGFTIGSLSINNKLLSRLHLPARFDLGPNQMSCDRNMISNFVLYIFGNRYGGRGSQHLLLLNPSPHKPFLQFKSPP